MVRIRLRRVGARNQASFRIVAAEKEAPRDGRFLEILGHYNPRTEPSTVVVDEARLFHWLKNGAQPSEAVVDALRALGTWDRWERFKDGEELEVLLKEAEESREEVDPRTRRDDLIGKRKKKSKARRKEEEAQAESEAEEADEEPAEEGEAEQEVEAEELAESEEEPKKEADSEEPVEAEEATEAEPEETEEPEEAEEPDEASEDEDEEESEEAENEEAEEQESDEEVEQQESDEEEEK